MTGDGQGRPSDTVGVTARPLSPAEAATVERFEAGEPAPESWSPVTARPVGDGDDLWERIATALEVAGPMTPTLEAQLRAALLPVVIAWAEQRARERAAEEGRSVKTDEALRLTEIAPRFWQRVQVGSPSSRWPWTGPTVPFGHGRFDSPVGNLAHRYAWALANLASPVSMLVRHKCDNPPCCNPRHLELGTYAENAQDAVVRGRAEWTLTTCRKNHPRTSENTSFRSGYPRCLDCERQATHARKHLNGAIYQCPECPSALSVHQMVRHQRKVHEHRVDAAQVRALFVSAEAGAA